MSYTISFYGIPGTLGNLQNIPSGWPCQLQPYSYPQYVSGLGYQLKTGENAYYFGDLNSSIINSDKAGFGIGETQTFMTESEYGDYINEHLPEYNSWKNGVKNPEVRDKTIKQIKTECQRRIVAPLGYNISQTTEFLARQINLNGRASEILLGIILGTATDADKIELQKMKSFFEKVKAARIFSNELEQKVLNGEEVDVTNTNWPEINL